MAGTYSVTATVNGCASPAGTTSVTVNPIPSMPTAGNGGAVCEGGTISLTASTVPGATYAWTGPNGFTSAAQNPTIPNATVAMAGTYSVTATVNGCTSPAGTTSVTVNPIPSTPTAGNSGAVCEGGTISHRLDGFGHLRPTAWTGLPFAAAQNPTIPSATVAMAGTYSVTTTVNGRTSPASTTNVTVNPIPSTPTANRWRRLAPDHHVDLPGLSRRMLRLDRPERLHLCSAETDDPKRHGRDGGDLQRDGDGERLHLTGRTHEASP
ncbi:MAG: immunoglobulin domain-containing protein [Holophagales bacterium]|nr:immunoglobulin domain-containing protein [Holophagales bacterium]